MKALKQDAEKRPCGCSISTPSASGPRVPLYKCLEAERLWAVLIRARDEMREAENRGQRKGRKARIDAFAAARKSYHDHLASDAEQPT